MLLLVVAYPFVLPLHRSGVGANIHGRYQECRFSDKNMIYTFLFRD